MGISGANFLVAETGTLVIITNEGNGRMCTTMPDLHVAVAGIDKVVPDWDSLTVLLKLLARSATGQKISTYTSFITGPRRAAGENGPKEFHLVLLDNGRSRIVRDPVAREVLKCIRCGCCLNVCPVYKNVGGFAYGWFISGPIGAILSPQLLGTQVGRELPYASSLCGACADVCPVKIPIPKILLHLRHRVAEGDDIDGPAAPRMLRVSAKLSAWAIGTPWLYRLGTRLLPIVQAPFRRGGWLPALPPPLNRWTKARPLPAFRARFRQWWKNRQ
jgi:L-lactate dehydrogenase complex protein LldF